MITKLSYIMSFVSWSRYITITFSLLRTDEAFKARVTYYNGKYWKFAKWVALGCLEFCFERTSCFWNLDAWSHEPSQTVKYNCLKNQGNVFSLTQAGHTLRWAIFEISWLFRRNRNWMEQYFNTSCNELIICLNFRKISSKPAKTRSFHCWFCKSLP